MNIAVFCSGNGSNFQAIVEAGKKGLFNGKIALMVCDNPKAYAIERAKKESIKTFVIEKANFPSKDEFEKAIIAQLEKEKIELICLAGYMRLLTSSFIKKYRDRILNVHPALLPSFKGTKAIRDAIENSVKVTGVTVHFVNEEMDSGPIILQEAVKIGPEDTEETLAERIHALEHRLYPEAIKLFLEKKIRVIGKRVKILAAAAVFFLVFGFESEAMLGNSVVPTLHIELEPVKIEPLKVKGLPFGIKDSPLEEKDRSGCRKAKGYDERLGIFPVDLYGRKEPAGAAPDNIKLLNPAVNIEKPLTKEEIQQIKIAHSIKAARVVAEVMDSIDADFAYKGINGLIDTARKVIDFRNHMKEKYHLHFRVSKDKALFRYKKRF